MRWTVAIATFVLGITATVTTGSPYATRLMTAEPSRMATSAMIRLGAIGPRFIGGVRLVATVNNAHPASAAPGSPPSVLSIAIDGLSQGRRRGPLSQD